MHLYMWYDWTALGMAAFITFMSYEIIPWLLTVLRNKERLHVVAAIATGDTFTKFVQWCGFDHQVMFWCMFGGHWLAHHGYEGPAIFVLRLAILSAWGVAIISLIAALAIWGESDR